MPISTPARLLASVASLAIVAATGPALAQNSVGTAAAVNPRSTGNAGSGVRTLELGSSIIHRERIETSSAGSVQVLFVDKTTLNIGPNSNLVIDEFVYDPNAKAGSMALTLTKGAARFVGGNASHTGGAEVKTPVATIGIRGGVAAIIHRDGETQAILQFGTLTVVGPGGETIVIRRPGFMVTVGRGGMSGPVRVSQAQIDAVIAQTRSQTGQTGGRRGPVADTTGLDRGSSHPCGVPVQGQTTMDLAAATCRSVNTALQGEADTIAQQASQQNQGNVVIPVTPPPYSYGGGGGGFPGGYGGGGGFPSFPNLPTFPNIPSFPGFPGGGGGGGGGGPIGGGGGGPIGY
ncbi:FecR family protein [Xanthobacter aminoxidans]|uniref:FecR family protein n=1 Tax=Xanthobacter aminoxidans TaxID=186280 RepID=UPI0020230E2A|nr:FecR family protein [Xanthobacter aminoxidans]MCL8385395.1 FecR family protein [Xanthobacter aminoxidans]